MEVSAEVHFAQTLASNDKKFRDRALKRLKKYISVRSSNGEGLSHDDFVKLWKGLHYCMWMQDKPLIQEELSSKMVSLLHAFPKLQDALSFVNVFFITEAREWTGIDRLRLDKFMLLMREILYETFELLSCNEWPLLECQRFAQSLTVVIMNESSVKIPYGIKMHLADIYLAEMRKVSFSGMNAKKLTILMFPFIYFILKTRRHELAQTIYNKTLKLVFEHFGNWPWIQKKVKKAGKDSKRKNQAQNVEYEEEEEDMEEDVEEEDGDDSGEERDDELEDTSEDEKASSDDDDVDMEVDREDTPTKRKRYNLTGLIRMLHRLAQDPKVEVRNRRYVYGIIKGYNSKDPSILQCPAQNGCEDNEDDDADVGMIRVFQLTGEEEKDEIDDRKQRRKRNRKRRREEEKGETTDMLESVSDAINTGGNRNEALTTANQKNKSSSNILEENNKKKKKKKNNMHETAEKENGGDNAIYQMKPLKQINENNKNEKKIFEESESSNQKQHQAEELTSSAKKRGKKRKRLSSGGEQGESTSDEVNFKKLKISSSDNDKMAKKVLFSPGNVSNNNTKTKSPIKETSNLNDSPASTPTTTAKKQEKKTLSLSGDEKIEENDVSSNINANAKSPPRSTAEKIKNKKPVSLGSPVECVIYKQKSPIAKPASINKLAKTMTSHSPSTTKFVVHSSPSRPKPNLELKIEAVPPLSLAPNQPDASDNGDVIATSPHRKDDRAMSRSPKFAIVESRSPPRAKKSRSSPSPAASVTTTTAATTPKGHQDTTEVSGVMDSLYNVMTTPCSMIKKAVGMVAPATDPGAFREKAVTLPEQLTPGTQKKVVFDLRRNKANKFKDYLKTLATDPSPAFEPGKSPGQGILKSPSIESLESSSTTSIGNTPVTRRKKRKGSASKRKSQSPLLR